MNTTVTQNYIIFITSPLIFNRKEKLPAPEAKEANIKLYNMIFKRVLYLLLLNKVTLAHI